MKKELHKGDDIGCITSSWLSSVTLNRVAVAQGHIGRDQKILFGKGQLEFLRIMTMKDGFSYGFLGRSLPSLASTDWQNSEMESIDAASLIKGIISQMNKLKTRGLRNDLAKIIGVRLLKHWGKLYDKDDNSVIIHEELINLTVHQGGLGVSDDEGNVCWMKDQATGALSKLETKLQPNIDIPRKMSNLFDGIAIDEYLNKYIQMYNIKINSKDEQRSKDNILKEVAISNLWQVRGRELRSIIDHDRATEIRKLVGKKVFLKDTDQNKLIHDLDRKTRQMIDTRLKSLQHEPQNLKFAVKDNLSRVGDLANTMQPKRKEFRNMLYSSWLHSKKKERTVDTYIEFLSIGNDIHIMETFKLAIMGVRRVMGNDALLAILIGDVKTDDYCSRTCHNEVIPLVKEIGRQVLMDSNKYILNREELIIRTEQIEKYTANKISKMIDITQRYKY